MVDAGLGLFGYSMFLASRLNAGRSTSVFLILRR
jgi:hypothetical protein